MYQIQDNNPTDLLQMTEIIRCINTSDAKRLKLLEKENSRLKRIIANQALDMEILKDVNSKNS